MLEGGFEKELVKGEILFREGDPGDEIYIIKRGKIRIYKNIEGEEKTLAILKEGEIFGEMAVLDGKPRSASAEALENTILEVLSKESILSVINSDPMIKFLIDTMVERLRTADEQLRLLTIRHEEQRFLTYLIIRYKEGISEEIPLEEIEYFTGIDKKIVLSLIKDLEKRGLIEFKNQKIKILKSEEIEEYRKYIFLKEKFEREKR